MNRIDFVHSKIIAIRGRFWYYYEIERLGCVAKRLIRLLVRRSLGEGGWRINMGNVG
jgi:hypothetical protein